MKNFSSRLLSNYKLFILQFFLWLPTVVQATLSIVAADPATGKVGSAGFTCICNYDLRNKIAMVAPGKGAFNAQAGAILQFFPNTKNYLLGGYNAFEVINANLADKKDINVSQILSATLNPGTGVNFGNSPNAFAFTGNGNANVNYYRYGQNFAIAGNILISKAVLDDAYNAFLNTHGELEDKLMAALLAAKRPGSDSRCLSVNTSSYVAYISVAKPNDPFNQGFLELQYMNPCGVSKEPVDILNTMFINWKRANAGLPPMDIPVLNITSIINIRQPTGDNGYTFNGSRMVDSRAKVLNADNFGMYGYTQAKVNINDAFSSQGSITQSAINNLSTDLLFIGSFSKTLLGASGFTASEINEAYNWSLGDNKTAFIFESGAEWNSFFSKWGYGVTAETSNPNKQYTVNANQPISKKIFSGPFGNITGIQQGGGLQGYFSKMPPNAIVLAVNNSNRPVLVYDCATKDILCSDTDVITSLGGISAGNVVTNDNDKFLANLISLVVDIKTNRIQLPACTTAAKQSSVSNSSLKAANNGLKEKKTKLLFPNPAKSEFFIDLNDFKNQKINIAVYNQNNILLYAKSVNKTQDSQREKIDAQNLPEGVLYVVVSDEENNKISEKIIIKH
ncbi:DUF1028 domain-containing protein [Chryseobacterium sp. RU37D]|uniref:DUF1028 domain-containing protein n=1 Tax=Chryseobacterium sp. RU37D TaxID=1907397 RepID=UPI0015C2F857|nr:DUF1028 domain-containing protein [Chryseobacterium sp. RU37D]